MRNDLAISANMQFLRWLAQWIKYLLCKLADQSSDPQNACKYQMGVAAQKVEMGGTQSKTDHMGELWGSSKRPWGQVRDSASVNKVESGGETSSVNLRPPHTCTQISAHTPIHMLLPTCVNTHIHKHMNHTHTHTCAKHYFCKASSCPRLCMNYFHWFFCSLESLFPGGVGSGGVEADSPGCEP